jgi:hypothetical protein
LILHLPIFALETVNNNDNNSHSNIAVASPELNFTRLTKSSVSGDYNKTFWGK